MCCHFVYLPQDEEMLTNSHEYVIIAFFLLGSVIVLVITNLLPLAMTLYEDLGYLCVQDIDDEEYSKSFKNNSKKQ
jgi:hypothetical protein